MQSAVLTLLGDRVRAVSATWQIHGYTTTIQQARTAAVTDKAPVTPAARSWPLGASVSKTSRICFPSGTPQASWAVKCKASPLPWRAPQLRGREGLIPAWNTATSHSLATVSPSQDSPTHQGPAQPILYSNAPALPRREEQRKTKGASRSHVLCRCTSSRTVNSVVGCGDQP
jgi:hypothetical protein